MPNFAFATVLLALAASAASAGTVAVPAAPVSPYADTEAVTNAAVRPSLVQRARTFSGDIALYATPSNALEVAFGTSRNGDGILLPGDETFSIGKRKFPRRINHQTTRLADKPVSAGEDGGALEQASRMLGIEGSSLHA